MEKLKTVIKKYNSDAVVIPVENDVFICSNYPYRLEQPIKDYIDCNYKVIYQDLHSINFKEK